MKFASLKQKLIVRAMVTLASVFIIVLVFVTWVSTSRAQEDQKDTSELITKGLEQRGKNTVLAISQAYGIHFYDNSFDDPKRTLIRILKQDDDLLYAVMSTVSSYSVILDREYVKNIPDEDDLDLRRGEMRTLEFREKHPEFDWLYDLDYNNEGTNRRTVDGQEVLDIGATIVYDGDILGHVLFGYTTAGLKARLEDSAAEFRKELRQYYIFLAVLGLAAIFSGWFITRQQANTITQPLGILTNAADTIASGDYDIKVDIHSGDEIELLAKSFNQMAEDLDSTYRDLHQKNRELHQAQDELEDLNKHLEEKVEERTAQLKESETKFRSLFEESADAILLSTENEFLDCNRAMLKMMNCDSKDEFLKMKPADISPPNQPDGVNSEEHLKKIYNRALSDGSQHFEWVHQRKDGQSFYAEIVLTAFPLHGKQVLHKVFRDITERKRTEEALREAQQKLLNQAHSAGMAEIATGVLHNIGNILNSVNISIEEIMTTLSGSKLKGFIKANEMVQENKDNLGNFLTQHPKGQLIPGYYLSLGEAIQSEHELVLEEADSLVNKVNMMRDVISTQQSYAKTSLYTQDVNLQSLIEDALKIQIVALNRQGVKVIKRYDNVPRGNVSKVKIMHVLTNLIKNAKEAMSKNEGPQELLIELGMKNPEMVEIKIKDNGIGVEPDNLEKIFNHGFTTKEDGHGFGLHTCANFMTEMDGVLTVESEGLGKGATFVARFPLMAKGSNAPESPNSAGAEAPLSGKASV